MTKVLTNGVIEVQSKDGGFLSQGTGWFLRPGVVVTALHVVGKLPPQLGWMHSVPGNEGATYNFVHVGMSTLALRPLCFDASADIALLQCDPPLSDAIKVELAGEPPLNQKWYADGVPGFDPTVEWTLSGNIVSVRGDRLQLVVDQGTQVSWQGVSGSALRVGYRVAGLITAETSATNTVWAAAGSAILRLLATYDASLEAAQLLGSSLDWNTDRETLLGSLVNISRVHPEVIEPRNRIAAIGCERPQWHLSSDVLEDLNSYHVGPIEDGLTRLVRRELAETASHLYDPWDEFENLFTGRYGADRFGGRTEQLKALDEFVESDGGGYFYITGSAGLGKTALLAEWIRCFRARGERPAFHFIGRVKKYLDDPRAEIGCLVSLCKQLLDLHQLGGALPSEIDQLRKLYRLLLTLPAPPGERVVVVLDGLDEALPDWVPGIAMFPKLADRVKVIFSAGPVANKDWLQDLQLTLVATCMRALDRLGPDAIQDVLRRAGIAQATGASFETLCGTVVAVTQGDPDYVADVLELLLERLKEGNMDLVGALRGFPGRHSDYLRQWWNSAFEDLQMRGFGNAFDDLMGTLAALREPLTADDLARVSGEDELQPGHMDTLLKYAARYVEGNSRIGYHLVRSRVIDLVNQQLEDQMKIYGRRVADFCRQWNSPAKSISARRYAVHNGVAHLLGQDDFDGAVALLDPGFIAAHWAVDGSYVSLLSGLDRLLNFAQAHPDNPEVVCRAPAFAIMRESARDLMRSLPTSLYACWVRLKGRSEITGLLNALPIYRGEARGPLLAVANEIFEMFPALDKASADRAWAGDLLGRTIGLLPLARTALWKFEAWSEICRILTKYKIEQVQLRKIIDQAQLFIEHIAERDADLKAACLAHLAKAMLPWNQEMSSEFLQRAETATYNLPNTDRAMVYAIAFPVYRALNPNRGEDLASNTIASLQTGPGLSRLSGARQPLIELLAAWTSEPASGPALAMARVLAERYMANPSRRFGRVPPGLLLRLGLHDLAWRILDRYKAKESDELNALQLTDCLQAAPEQSDSIRARIIPLYTDHASSPKVARALMLAGYQTEALAVVGRLSAKDVPKLVPQCLELVLREPASPERDAAVTLLIDRLEKGEGYDWAEGAARSALALARAGLPQARRIFESVLGRSLARLPEGDADRIRYLLGVALSCAGNQERAIATLRDCKSPTARVSGLVAALKATQIGSLERKQVTAEIKRQLAAVGPRATEAVALACEAGHVLATADRAEAAGLVDTIENIPHGGLSALSAATRLRVLLDPASGPLHARELVDRLWSGNGRPAMEDIQAVCSVIVRTAVQDREAAHGLFNRLLDWARGLDAGYRGQALAGLLGGVAEFCPEQSMKTLDEGLKKLRPERDAPTGGLGEIAAEQYLDLYRELTGRWPWVNELKGLLKGLTGAVPNLAESQLVSIFEAVRTWLLAVPIEIDEFQVAAEAYLAAAAGLPPDRDSVATHLLEGALPSLQTKIKLEQFSKLCLLASIKFAETGHRKAAERMLQYIHDNDSAIATQAINTCDFYYSLSDRTVLEEAFFEKGKPLEKQLMALFIQMIRQGNIGDALSAQIESLKQESVRYRVLDDSIFFMFAAIARWGIEGGLLIINALKQCDEKLVSAASQIAAA
jgi:hypothetical protein